MNSEIKSKKWLFAGIGLQFATGYIVAFLIYQIGTLVVTGALGTAFVPGLIAVIAIIAVCVLICVRTRKSIEKEYALKK